MNKEINTDEDYNFYIKKRIEEVMEILYKFEPSEKNNGSFECTILAKLILELGPVLSLSPHENYNIRNQHKLLDEWIEILNVEKVDCLFLVAFLRYTFPSRYDLKNWINLRDKTAIKLDSIGKDSKRLLRGLYV